MSNTKLNVGDESVHSFPLENEGAVEFLVVFQAGDKIVQEEDLRWFLHRDGFVIEIRPLP